MAAMTGAALARLRTAVFRWYRRHGRDLPWRRTREGYRILVSEIMLQQTQVDRVIPKYEFFVRTFPTAASLANASLGAVLRAWSGLGYNGRARRLWECARELARPRGSRLSADPAAMRSLPGVGRYTAAAVACFAFGARVPVVDTNVRRVLSRAMLGKDDVGEPRAWELAGQALPRNASDRWNQALMDIGALYCRPAPRCDACPARWSCRYAASHPDGSLPTKRASASRPRQGTFPGSRRYFRGRIVNALARAPSLGLLALGEQVKPGFEETDLPWLLGLLTRLSSEGLVALDLRRKRARLP
jgi:A/G-specific adenine glycosylase